MLKPLVRWSQVLRRRIWVIWQSGKARERNACPLHFNRHWAAFVCSHCSGYSVVISLVTTEQPASASITLFSLFRLFPFFHSFPHWNDPQASPNFARWLMNRKISLCSLLLNWGASASVLLTFQIDWLSLCWKFKHIESFMKLRSRKDGHFKGDALSEMVTRFS